MMDLLDMEVFSKLLPFLNPRHLCVWMRTCKRNWDSVTCTRYAGIIEEYWRKHFFKFLHGNFGWVIGQCYNQKFWMTPLTPLTIRAHPLTPAQSATNEYGKVEQISTGCQVWTGTKYTFTVEEVPPQENSFNEFLLSRSTSRSSSFTKRCTRGSTDCTGRSIGTGTGIISTGTSTGGVPFIRGLPGGYRSWRDACTDVSQRTLLDRDCKRGFAQGFKFGTETWTRVPDAALTADITSTVKTL
eukprot:Lankesteria_metandrocarpae@DN382_c0_g1_i1.p2